MAKSKHSKVKNTQILFELLTRQVAADTIKGVENSPALGIIKKYFKNNSLLANELGLYESLCNQSYKTVAKADMLLREVLKARKRINDVELRKVKYSLIKEISGSYILTDFLKTALPNYKLYASIYNIFESLREKTAVTPVIIVESRYSIVEHITRGNKPGVVSTVDPTIEEYKKQTEDIRLLAYKMLIETFNKKYKNLTVRQKGILKEYINNVSNSDNLRRLLVKEVKAIKVEIKKLLPFVKDRVTVIKINEVLNIAKKFTSLKRITEKHVLSVLMYVELLEEIKVIKNVKA